VPSVSRTRPRLAVPDEIALKASLLGTEAMVRKRLRVYRASGESGALARTLRIERAAADTGRIKETKTGDDREVDLSPRLVAALGDFRGRLEADALVAGRDDISPSVFATRVGKPPRPHRVAKTFHKVLLAAGLPHFRLYDLRPTYASHLIAQGADIAYMAKQLGHAKMTTTLLFYGHWFPKGDRHYVERMGSVRASAAPLNLPTPHDDSGAVLDADEAPNERSWHHFGTTSELGWWAVGDSNPGPAD
jgi:integrase